MYGNWLNASSSADDRWFARMHQFGPMMSGWDWTWWPMMVFGWLVVLLVIVSLILVIVYLWKLINGCK